MRLLRLARRALGKARDAWLGIFGDVRKHGCGSEDCHVRGAGEPPE